MHLIRIGAYKINMRNLIAILGLTFMALQGGSVMAAPAGKSVVDVHYLSNDSQVPGASSTSRQL
jgi:hypothetical protein